MDVCGYLSLVAGYQVPSAAIFIPSDFKNDTFRSYKMSPLINKKFDR